METNKLSFNNDTQYNRAMHENKYTVITNDLINDLRLSPIEIGIMVMILSNSDSFIFNSTLMQKRSTLGKVMFYNSMKKLIEFGYIQKKAKVKGGWLWTINETPVTPTEAAKPTEEIEQVEKHVEVQPEPELEQTESFIPTEEIELEQPTEIEEESTLFVTVEKLIKNARNPIDAIDELQEYISISDLIFIKNNYKKFIEETKIKPILYNIIYNKLIEIEDFELENFTKKIKELR